MSRVKLAIAGKAWHAAIDPKASRVPTDEGWEPHYGYRRVGRGGQYLYEVTVAQAALMASHLQELGETFSAGGVDDELREGPACLAAAQKIEEALIEVRGKD